MEGDAMTSPAVSVRRALVALLAVVGSLVAVTLGTTAPAAASHYRANQLTWHAGAAPNAVEFHLSGSWRCTFFADPCDVAPGEVVTTEYVDPGDGAGYVEVEMLVVSVDVANDVVTADGHATYTYGAPGAYVASSSGCCRLSSFNGHLNNGDGDIRYETLVNLPATSASPVGLVPPIVDCPVEAVCTFSVPASDPDNQPMRWRLATAEEASGYDGGFTQPSGASIDATSGLYTWDTRGAELAPTGSTFYSTQVMIENVVAGTVVSRTAVDFFIRLGSNSTNAQPVFVSPTPANGAVIAASVGAPMSFQVAAQDSDATDVVTPSVLGAPSGATFTPTPGNPATGTFSWTPTAVGDVNVTLLAADDKGLGAVPRTVTIRVTDVPNPPPTVDAGPDKSGTNRVAVSLDGTVTDTEPVTTKWTATAPAGAPAGASCTFGDANAVDTTVTCTAGGAWTLTLTADDGANPPVSDSMKLTLANPSPTVDAGPDKSAANRAEVTLDGTVTDNDPTTTTWTATPLSGVPSGATCTFANAKAVDTVVTCSAAGVWTLTLTADDGVNPPVSDSMKLTVTNPSPVVDAGANVSGAEGTAISLNATVTDTEPVSTAWTATAGAGVDAGATCAFANPGAVDTTVTCTDDGTWTLTLTGNDGTNPAVSDTTTLTVANAAPTVSITAPAAGAATTTGTAVSLSATTGDPGSNDTRTCAIGWGDGSSSSGTMASGTCTGSHTYTTAGSRTITVTVTDDDGGTATATRSLTVNTPTPPPPPPPPPADEKAKVTGGGWLKDGRDKIRFGFVAKSTGSAYRGKITVRTPDGKLKGTTVSDLSVSGRTATWKGTGKWNGKKGCTFVVDVKDPKGKKTQDTFAITVKDAKGKVVLKVGGPIKKGQVTIH
jgi:hypothetical protein